MSWKRIPFRANGQVRAAFLAAITVMSFTIACKKTFKVAEPGSFNAGAAKEWYYGVFKKSAEWARSDLHGKKLPDWKNGLYRKIGNLEMVEFPLFTGRKTISAPSANADLGAQRRVIEGSLSKIIFFKNATGIIVREVDYIADHAYLQQMGYDLSGVSLAKSNNSFSGRLVVKDWAGTVLSTWLMRGGRQISKAFIISKPGVDGPGTEQASENCTTIEICEYEQICTEYWSGDVKIGEECGPWVPTGNCWYEEYCDADLCDGSTQDCACQVFGVCDDGGGGDGDDPIDCSENFSKQTSGSAAADLESIELESNTATTRTKNYRWVIYKQSFGMWSFSSHDKGVHEKVNDEWKWASLTHENISRSGMVIGGSLECQLNSATPEVGQYNAIMSLNCTINVSIACKGSPLSTSIDFSTAKAFNVND